MTRKRYQADGRLPWADVEAYGAWPGNSPTANRAAIQAAIDAVMMAGGGRVIVPRNYHIAGASLIVDSMNDASINVDIVGMNRERSSITQDTASTNVLTVGRTADLGSAVYFRVYNLTLTGPTVGGHCLDLNNALHPMLDYVHLDGGDVGLYTQGAAEEVGSHELMITGSHLYGMSVGNDNGGGGNNYMQKSTFEHLVFQALYLSGTACAKIDGNNAASGAITMRDVRFMGGPPIALDVNNCFNLKLDTVSNEMNARLPAPNTYSLIVLSNSTSIIIENSWFAGATNDPGNFNDKYKYTIEQKAGGGFLTVRDTTFSITAPPSSADIYCGGSGLIVDGCIFGAGTPRVEFAGTTQLNQSELRTSWIGDGTLVRDWHNGQTSTKAPEGGGLWVPSISQSSYGGSTRTTTTTTYVMATNGTVDLGATTLGLAELESNASAAIATCQIRGVGQTVVEISDPVGMLEVTNIGTAYAIYWDGSTYLLHNKTGGSVTVTLTLNTYV